MRRFRHKHTGQVVTKGTDGLYHSQEGGYTLQRWIFENSNDWEEVKEEPNYLITAFRETKDLFGERKIASIDKDGLYGGWHSLEGMLKNPPCVESNDFEIYSVKNSKGEEFTIGDLAYFQTHLHIVYKTSKILSFKIIEGDIILALTEDREGSIEWLHKSEKKSPIYTTTDGVDIFEGDKLYLFLANKDLTIPFANEVGILKFNNTEKEVASRYLTFTSEENRDKYIKENSKKPIFVSADEVEMYEGDTVWHFCDELDFQLSSSIVRKNNIYGNIRFSSEEKAREYIDNNKPKYSLMDIENAYCKAMNSEFDGFGEIVEELKKLGK